MIMLASIELSLSGFPYKTVFKEGAWFMGCYDARFFIFMKDPIQKIRTHRYSKSEVFLQRHFIFTPWQKQNDREPLKEKFSKRRYKKCLLLDSKDK